MQSSRPLMWFAIISIAGCCCDDVAHGGCEPAEAAKLIASDAAVDDNFGHVVAISTDTAVVGDLYKEVGGQVNAGAAYVYERVESPGTVEWTQRAILIAPDPQMQDWFGTSVALQEDTIVIGARGRELEGMTNVGAVYVFSRTQVAGESVWVQQATLVPSDPTVHAAFGRSVAISGDTVVVGAYGLPAAYVFVERNGGWVEQAKLISPDGSATSVFGNSVTISGDTLAVGDPRDEINGLDYAGSAHIFVREKHQWKHQVKLVHPDPQFNDQFGYSVALLGDTALVGADLDDHAAQTNAGSAFVFQRSSDTWVQQAMLTASEPASLDFFGESVALRTDSALIGATGQDHNGQISSGAAYLFARVGDRWMQQATLTTSDNADGDHFGKSLAADGNVAIIGASGDDHLDVANAGSAYIFSIGCPLGDVTHDGTVDVDDLLVVINAWGKCPPPPTACVADVNGDMVVDVDDLLMVINNWG
jgi:hypothetical protein